MHLELKYGWPVVSVVVFLTGGTAGIHFGKVVETAGSFEVNRFTYLAFGLSGGLAADYVDRSQPLAAALAALMRSKVWDRVEQKIRCLQAISRVELNEEERLLLGNVVQTYLKLKPDEKKRFEEEMQRSSNKEVQNIGDHLGRRTGRQRSQRSEKRRGVASEDSTQTPLRESAGLDRRRLGKASQQELESWATRVLEAERLEDVFNPA